MALFSRYQYKHPETGPTRTEYTAGARGFRARGTDIARQMDLSQIKQPYSPPVDPNSPNYNPTYDGYHDPNEDPSYKFNIRTPTFVKDEVAGSQGQVKGSYTYTDDIGEVHRVDYEAGAGKGFRVKNPVPDNTQIGKYYGGPGIPPRGRTSVQQGEDGSYTFVAQGPNLRRAEKRDNQGRVAGSYSYIDDKGAEKTVSYIAGPETGYQIVNKVQNEFIPLFESGYFPSVTPVIPFATKFPSFPTSATPDIKNKIPTTNFAPLFPSSTTTFRPTFPSPLRPSFPNTNNNFDDLFGSPEPTKGSFAFSSTTSAPGVGYNNNANNNNKNGNKTPNNFASTTTFPPGGIGDFSSQDKPGSFLNPQSNVLNPSGGFGSGDFGGYPAGSGSPVQSSSSRPSNSQSSGSGGNDFLTGPNINSLSNHIPVISFPVENPHNKPGDYSNICKVCRTLREQEPGSGFFNGNNQGFRPTYNTYHENNNGGDEFSGFPHGVAVRAHVQSIDLYPFGSRVPEPGEAIDSFARIDRSSPEQFEREVLYTTPSTNLVSSLHNARANSIENTLKNEYNKIKSDRIIATKVDYKDKNQNETIDVNNNIEASTYRGNLAREEFEVLNKKSTTPDLFKNFNLFGNQTNNFLSSGMSSDQYKTSEYMKKMSEDFDSLFQEPQNNKARFTQGSQLNQGIINNAKSNLNQKNTNSGFRNNQNINLSNNNNKNSKYESEPEQNKPASKNCKIVGPNLLELLQKEVRSRPIYVPDLPEESNELNLLPDSQAQTFSTNSNFSPFESSSTSSPEVRPRNPPRGRKRGSSRYSRTPNKDNLRGKERKLQ